MSTLAEMGLNTLIINPSGALTVSSTDTNQRFNILSACNTMMVYIELSPELFNSMVDEQGVIRAMSSSPVQATFTYCYHASERHLVSLRQEKSIIVEAQLNAHAQQVRDGQG